MNRALLRLAAIISVAGILLATWNYVSLHRILARVISEDSRNAGVKAIAHFQWYVKPDTLVFDIRDVADSNSPLDVTRTLLQLAKALQHRKFETVVLAFRGQERFVMKGDYFQTLGQEYDFQNPVYTLRTLPENIYNLDGSPAFGTWTGGMLGVVGGQMEDLNEFSKRWYLSDLLEDAGGSDAPQD